MLNVRRVSGKGYIVTDTAEVIGVTVNLERTVYNRLIEYKETGTKVYLNDATTEICVTNSREVVFRGIGYYHVEDENWFAMVFCIVTDNGTIIKDEQSVAIWYNKFKDDEKSKVRGSKCILGTESYNLHITSESFISGFNLEVAPRLLELNEMILKGEVKTEDKFGHLIKRSKNGSVIIEDTEDVIKGFNIDTSKVLYSYSKLVGNYLIFMDGLQGHYCILHTDGYLVQRGFNYMCIEDTNIMVFSGGIITDDGILLQGTNALNYWLEYCPFDDEIDTETFVEDFYPVYLAQNTDIYTNDYLELEDTYLDALSTLTFYEKGVSFIKEEPFAIDFHVPTEESCKLYNDCYSKLYDRII